MKRNLLAAKHRRVFHEQSHRALAIAVVGRGICPEPQKILRHGEDRRSLFVIEDPAAQLSLFLIPLLSFRQCP
jgi:hypothetical protein